MSTATAAAEIKVHPGVDGSPTVVDIGDTSYFAYDLGDRVRLEKFSTQGGEVYTLPVGLRGVCGCNCPHARYRRVVCKHQRAATMFLNETL